jgi:Ino eighty subunit 1
MRTNLSSKSRANAFLWIMWFYLESDFTEEGCEENPFGPGVDYGVDLANQGVPHLVELDEAEEALENQDTQEEIQFGEDKKKMRAKILEADQQFLADTQNKRGGRGRAFTGDEASPASGILPRIRPAKHEASDIDSVRSTPPPRGALKGAAAAAGSTYRRPAGVKYHMYDGSSPSGSHHADRPPVEGVLPRKPRPPTAHQLAVERNRMQRIEYILDQGIRKSHHRSRKLRRSEGTVVRALKRLRQVEHPFADSEDEEEFTRARSGSHWLPPVNHAVMDNSHGDKPFAFRERGYGGLCQLKSEEDDFGEEAASYAAAIRRSHRRLSRWEAMNNPDMGVVPPTKRERENVPDKEDDGFDDDMLDDDMDKDQSMMLENGDTEDELEAEAETLRQQQASKRRGGAKGGRGKRASGAASRMNGARTNGGSATPMEIDDDDDHDLNDVEKSLLGMTSVAMGIEDDEEELDELDKTLLGFGSDSE